MENTLENKAKFFAQYWGQNIMTNYQSRNENTERVVFVENRNYSYLLLKPLLSISDEDAIKVAKILGWNVKACELHTLIEDGLMVALDGSDSSSELLSLHIAEEIISYLRSKGYALPYNGLSVEEQLNYNWIKLVS